MNGILSSGKISEIRRFFLRFKVEVLSLGVVALSLLLVSYLAGAQRVGLQGQAESAKGKPVSSAEQSGRKLTKNQEIAKNLLSWVSDKKDSRGIYYLNCDSVVCAKPVMAGKSGHGGLPIIWGRFLYFQKTKDPAALNDLVVDMDNYLDKSKIISIQNQNWNCKLMYQISNSPLAAAEVKSKAENLCFSSEYFPLEKQTSDLNNNLENLLAGKTASVPKLSLFAQKGVREFSYYPSDFVARYLWKKNLEDLAKAKNYFGLGLSAYAGSKSKLLSDDICALGESSLDLYQVTDESNYLLFAKQLFEKDFDSLSPVCGIFADSLYKTTNLSGYLAKKESVLNSLVKNNLPVDYDLRKVGLLVGLLLE